MHVGAGPECRWECVEDIQSCVALVHCVGVSCGVGRSLLQDAFSHTENIYIYIYIPVCWCVFFFSFESRVFIEN